ncbi:Kelch repeat-containing protein [Reichenbachiella agariperforans]|nr:kelch repeat-containing protein [Reichenbachiella agariperforans]
MKRKGIIIQGIALVCLYLSASVAWSQEWQTIACEGHATKRHESGLTIHDGSLYLIGGRGVKPVEALDLKKSSWQHHDPTPLEMHHITPVSIGDRIYVVGGLTGGYPTEQPLTHVYSYDPNTDQWKTVLEIPVERRRGAGGVVVQGDDIYLVNGITNGHTSGTNAMMDVYHTKTNTWEVLPDVPHIRDHSAAVIIGEQLYALGGRNTSYHEADNFMAFFTAVVTEIDVYDMNAKEWMTLDVELPIPSAGPGVVVWEEQLIYLGGETGDLPARDEVYSFDTKSEVWKALPELNQGRHGTNAALWKGKLYIGAGSGNRGGGPELNSVEVLELE